MSVKERPILFSTEMVQAVLEERKTQTRRIVKPQPFIVDSDGAWKEDDPNERIKCPYGKPGDILWVRESFTLIGDRIRYKTESRCDPDGWVQTMNEIGSRWKPSIHMPKSAARIWLKVKDVRVEKLRDISNEDAKAEGIKYIISSAGFCGFDHFASRGYNLMTSARVSFFLLWNKIHGHDRYSEPNPWVWVVKFEVLSTTGRSSQKSLQREEVVNVL